MGYRDNIVDVAISQLGYTEGANNDTIYGDWYGLPNQPWCAMFVSWCADQAGIPQDIINPFASCTTGFKWFTNEDETTREHIVPNKGDIIFFIWNKASTTPDHVGIVEYAENGIVHTIEGNRSDKVERFSYTLDDWRIYGYATPNYGDTPEPSGDQQIIDIQKWIIDAYGLPIQVTGEFDKQTKLYITMAYQMELNENWLDEEHQISVDGIFGQETKAATPILSYGDENDLVSLVQSMLYCRGYYLEYGVSGEYDNSTANAVGSFQINHNLKVDKIYGPNTGYKLYN